MSALAPHNRQPLFVDVKGNVLDDGPGIRTVVFFKGCPLDCLWCHNPESKRLGAELMFEPEKCLRCGRCAETCSPGAIRLDSEQRIDRERCSLCFDCVDSCPARALVRVGEAMDIQTLLARIEKYAPFFISSGGGVTFSGGEPTLCMEYLSRIMEASRDRGIHTLLETCGLFEYGLFEQLVLPHADTIYMDIKLIDSRQHRRFCGSDNGVILDNFVRLHRAASASDLELLPRIPLVPGITDSPKNISDIIEFLSTVGVRRADLLPNNPLWPDKSRKIGRPVDETYLPMLTRWYDSEELETLRSRFRRAGIETSRR